MEQQLPEIDTRVRRGVELFDRFVPDWHRYVVPEDINIAFAKTCVASLVGRHIGFSNWYDFCAHLGIPEGCAGEYGLLPIDYDDLKHLNREWRTQTERRNLLALSRTLTPTK